MKFSNLIKREQELPVYLKAWFMVVLFFAGFFGAYFTPLFFLWLVIPGLIGYRIGIKKNGLPQPSEGNRSEQLDAYADTAIDTATSPAVTLADTFKGRQYKTALLSTQRELETIKASLSPEAAEGVELSVRIERLKAQAAELETAISKRTTELAALEQQAEDAKRLLVQLSEDAEMQSFGIYTPRYDFASADVYKERLTQIREQQKLLIKNDAAVTGNQGWTVNGSASQGKKMLRDMQKLLLRAFNSECDELIDNVKFNTFDTARRRMESSREAISKLGAIMSLAITDQYFNAKYEELCLAFEYRQKKQQEKEEQKAIRARMREEAKIQREIEEARARAVKEQTHYTNELERLKAQMASATESELPALLDKQKVMKAQLSEIEKSIVDIDYRQANARAGYVYIISNIGSFGENVYKIGMTRRLEPMERIDELGDASVPFDFDVHALIFSDNAPALEAALHRAFEDRKVNMVNPRREFFCVTLEEIEAVVRANYDKTVEFIQIPEAEQFRTSLKMREGLTE